MRCLLEKYVLAAKCENVNEVKIECKMNTHKNAGIIRLIVFGLLLFVHCLRACRGRQMNFVSHFDVFIRFHFLTSIISRGDHQR